MILRIFHTEYFGSAARKKEADAYLDAALEAGDRSAFLLAIRNVIDALGGMTQMARHTGLNRENLYRVLSEQGNPELNSLEKLLKGMGLRLAVEVDRELTTFNP